jgi:hypothetical protein
MGRAMVLCCRRLLLGRVECCARQAACWEFQLSAACQRSSNSHVICQTHPACMTMQHYWQCHCQIRSVFECSCWWFAGYSKFTFTVCEGATPTSHHCQGARTQQHERVAQHVHEEGNAMPRHITSRCYRIAQMLPCSQHVLQHWRTVCSVAAMHPSPWPAPCQRCQQPSALLVCSFIRLQCW